LKCLLVLIGKLGVFYFFFYLGLAGFFCAMLAVFMAITPRDRPRYYSESSSMRTRSNPLSPGLGFRPQPDNQKNLVFVDKNPKNNENEPFIKNLKQYLEIYYWKQEDNNLAEENKFIIYNPGSCTPENDYGYSSGKPCVLVKMNKIVGFKPNPGYHSADKDAFQSAGCRVDPNAIPVHCYGEYPADSDNIGNLTYMSENGYDNKCGSLETKWFPYTGKNERRDVYQAPYIWVQFNNPKRNVLINVICRVFAENIYFDRKASRALTRFQIYIKDILSQN